MLPYIQQRLPILTVACIRSLAGETVCRLELTFVRGSHVLHHKTVHTASFSSPTERGLGTRLSPVLQQLQSRATEIIAK